MMLTYHEWMAKNGYWAGRGSQSNHYHSLYGNYVKQWRARNGEPQD